MDFAAEFIDQWPMALLWLGLPLGIGAVLGFFVLGILAPILKKGENVAQRIYDVGIQGGLLVLLIVPPLAFGAVYPWGVALIELVALFMALAWALKVLRRGRLRLARTPLNLPILLFLGLVGVQLLPMAPGWLRIVSVHTYALYQRTLVGWPDHDPLPFISSPLPPDKSPLPSHQSPLPLDKGGQQLPSPLRGLGSGGQQFPAPLWGEGGGGGEGSSWSISSWRPLSLYPYATRSALLQAIAYAAVFVIIVNTVRTMAQLRWLLVTLTAVGGVVALVGLVQKVSGATKIYGLWQPEFGNAPFGPYVNRNHFAGYMAMVFPVGLGWLWGLLVQKDKRETDKGWRRRLPTLLSGRNGRLLLIALALVSMAAALIFSGSRGGIVSLAGSLLFVTLAVYRRRGEGRRLGLAIPIVMAFALAYALWLGLHPVIERFFQPEEFRPLIWKGTLNLVANFPVLGAGLDTYVYSFQRHKPTLDPGLVDHAHNDYLELLAEMGAVGLLIVVGGLGRFGWRMFRRWSTRHDPEVRGIVLGGLASMLAIGIHSLFDFNLHIPANALLLAMVLGMTCVAGHLRRQHGRWAVTFRHRRLRLPRPLCFALYPLVLLAGLAMALPAGLSVAADRQARLAERSEQRVGVATEPDTVAERWRRAVTLAPGDANYHYRLGQAYDRVMQAQWSSDPSRALNAGIQAMRAYREAILRNPTYPFPYLAWGWTLENVSRLAAWVVWSRALTTTTQVGVNDLSSLITELGQRPDGARTWSRQLVQTAAHLAPTGAFAHYSAGLYTLQQWPVLSSEQQKRVVQELRSAIQLEPSYAETILQALWERTQDRDLMQTMARGTSEEGRWRDLATNARSTR